MAVFRLLKIHPEKVDPSYLVHTSPHRAPQYEGILFQTRLREGNFSLEVSHGVQSRDSPLTLEPPSLFENSLVQKTSRDHTCIHVPQNGIPTHVTLFASPLSRSICSESLLHFPRSAATITKSWDPAVRGFDGRQHRVEGSPRIATAFVWIPRRFTMRFPTPEPTYSKS